MARTKSSAPYGRTRVVPEGPIKHSMYAKMNVNDAAARARIGEGAAKREQQVAAHGENFQHRRAAKREADAETRARMADAASLSIAKSEYNRTASTDATNAAQRRSALRNTQLPSGLTQQSRTSASVGTASGSVVANLVRVFVVIFSLAVVYLLVKNNGVAGSTFFSKVGSTLLNLTSGKPVFTVVPGSSLANAGTTVADLGTGTGGTSTTGTTPITPSRGNTNTTGTLQG